MSLCPQTNPSSHLTIQCVRHRRDETRWATNNVLFSIHSIRSFIHLAVKCIQVSYIWLCVRQRKVNDYRSHATRHRYHKANAINRWIWITHLHSIASRILFIMILTVNLISNLPPPMQVNWIEFRHHPWKVLFCNIKHSWSTHSLTHTRTHCFFITSLIRYVLILWYLTFIRYKTTIYLFYNSPIS